MNQNGLTLLEIMIALFIFTVGILAVATMQVVSMRSDTVSRIRMYENAAAGSILETFRTLPYDDPVLVDKDNGYYPDAPDFGPLFIQETRSTLEWEIADDFPRESIKRITIIIRQQAHRGIRKAPLIYDALKAKDCF